MSRLSENRHWLLFAGVVLTTLGAIGLAAVGVVATLSVLLTGGSLVTTVGAFLLGTLVLVGLDVVFAVALVRTLAGMARLPTNQRVADGFHRAESLVPPLSELGLGDRFEPPVEQRRETLADRYVEGDLSERELEAALDELLDDREADAAVRDITARDRSDQSGAHRELERET